MLAAKLDKQTATCVQHLDSFRGKVVPDSTMNMARNSDSRVGRSHGQAPRSGSAQLRKATLRPGGLTLFRSFTLHPLAWGFPSDLQLMLEPYRTEFNTS
jgi:hypothetical protein